VLGVRRWKELVTGKNGGILFDRPKPTAGCSASGKEVHPVGSYYTDISRRTVNKTLNLQNSVTQRRGIVGWVKSTAPGSPLFCDTA
jgi:hypothetical protein